MFAMRKVVIALTGSIVVLVGIVLLAQEQVIRPGIARTQPVVVYKAAHGLTSASVGKPLVENNDGTWSVVNDAALVPYVDGILIQVISADHFRIATRHSLVQVPVALLDGGASYSIATSGRMLYWDNSAGIYKAANPSDSNLGSATAQIISSLGATNVVVRAMNPMAPVSRLDVVTTTTNDDPTYSVRQRRIVTSDAAGQTLMIQELAGADIVANRTYHINSRVLMRRTDVAGDNAVYVIDAHLKVGATTGDAAIVLDQKTMISEDVGTPLNWNVVWAITEGTPDELELRVTGQAGATATWHVTSTVQMLSN